MGENKDMLIERAVNFATKAHAGAYRKGSSIPYVCHPIEAMIIASEMTKDMEVIAAAVLHDVIEDTSYTKEDIEERFGKRVADLVAMESENKRKNMPKSESWKIRKQESLDAKEHEPIEAKIIMLADKLSNLRATYCDYLRIGDEVWQKFNMKDKKEQEWYYRRILLVLEELKEFAAYQELESLVEKIFAKEGKN